MPELSFRFAPSLWLFLPPRRRRELVTAAYDGTSSLGHVVESLGVPLPEVGRMAVGDRTVPPGYRPAAGDVVDVAAVARPQDVPARFLLDVHLGALARWLRILGIDVCYPGDVADPVLVERANAEHRVLLTQDRGLLRRRALRSGAYVRGARPADQLADVLDRFAPELRPWTRCTACNGELRAVAKADVADDLPPGTRRSYQRFARCESCGRIYWHGAHSRRIAAVVESARRTVAARQSPKRAVSLPAEEAHGEEAEHRCVPDRDQ